MGAPDSLARTDGVTITVPFTVPLQDLARQLRLDKWLNSSKWPRDRFFALIDNLQAGLREVLQTEPTDDQLVPLLAAAVEAEGGLGTYCLNAGHEIGGNPGWKERCEAAAWMIVRRYRLAVSTGKWGRDD